MFSNGVNTGVFIITAEIREHYLVRDNIVANMIWRNCMMSGIDYYTQISNDTYGW